MTTIGQALIDQRQLRETQEHNRHAALLENFFKVVLWGEVQAAIRENREPNWIEAPADIRWLFSGPLPYGNGLMSHNNPKGKFWPVWKELHIWADGLGLRIATGETDDDTYTVGTPWDLYRWKGALLPSTVPWVDPETITETVKPKNSITEYLPIIAGLLILLVAIFILLIGRYI